MAGPSCSFKSPVSSGTGGSTRLGLAMTAAVPHLDLMRALRARDGGGTFTQRGARTAEGTCYFVLRAAEPDKTSKILLQLSTHTYNAYNDWGGSSLYGFHGRAGNQGHRVSSERPPNIMFGTWEQPFVEWAERNGYVLEHAANGDLGSRPEILKAHRLVLSVGHDE